MFVHNQPDNKKHIDVIAHGINNADEVLLAVAYVRKAGVMELLDKVEIKNKRVKLICTDAMNNTEWAALSLLRNYNVTVRICTEMEQGTFHPKLWLFGKNGNWKMLVGSANFTRAALMYNVEAGVMLEDGPAIDGAREFFDSLWAWEKLHEPSLEEINKMEQQQQWRKSAQKRVRQQGESKEKDLLEFVKNWIDISKGAKKGISSLWRGWYIIPDHGYVDDKIIARLASYLPYIGEGVDIADEDVNYQNLLKWFFDSSGYTEKNPKMTPHELFTRQSKNYLIKFGWVGYPKGEWGKANKQRLVLTKLGRQVANEEGNIPAIKKLYTEYFEEYSYNGLCVVPFTRRLLEHFGYLTLQEFDYFVTHAVSDGEFQWIVELIRAYRLLAPAEKKALDDSVKAYFDKVKSGTGKSVHGNYIKSVKHTMSAIAWCSDLYMSDDFKIQERNAD